MEPRRADRRAPHDYVAQAGRNGRQGGGFRRGWAKRKRAPMTNVPSTSPSLETARSSCGTKPSSRHDGRRLIVLGKNNEQCGYPCPIEGERSGVARAALRVLPLVPADTPLKTVCTKSTRQPNSALASAAQPFWEQDFSAYRAKRCGLRSPPTGCTSGLTCSSACRIFLVNCRGSKKRPAADRPALISSAVCSCQSSAIVTLVGSPTVSSRRGRRQRAA